MARRVPIFAEARGGFYDLQINLGEPSDARAKRAMQILWSSRVLKGPFQDYDLRPWEQPVWVNPDFKADGTHYWGLARLPNGASIACVALVYRFDFGTAPHDVLEFSLCETGLQANYPFWLGHREEADPLGSLPIIDGFLLEMARSFYAQMTFRRGAIGFELLGSASGGTRNRLGDGHLIEEHGELLWYPPQY